MKQPDGSFTMHEGGEIDIRYVMPYYVDMFADICNTTLINYTHCNLYLSVNHVSTYRGLYCALSVAALTNILTPELTSNCVEFIKRAQTYEGGIGPYPGKEAHNGYTYCGLAAMQILGAVDELDVDALLVSTLSSHVYGASITDGWVHRRGVRIDR